MKNVTVVILTKNEEKHIVDVIKNSQQLTPNILIVDSGSTDNTVSLAKELGADVVYRAWDNDFSAQRNFALKHVTTEWVLYLDADERMSSELIRSVKAVLLKNEAYLCNMKRKAIAFGRPCNYGTMRNDFVHRMFKVHNAKWIGKVHEHVECSDKTLTLNGHIDHYTYESWEQYFNKFNQYTTIAAKNYQDNNKKVGFFTDIVFRPFWAFIKMYIFNKGFLDGKMGFILSIYHAVYTLTKYVKLYHLLSATKQKR